MSREAAFPIGAGVTIDQLETDPHPVLTRLREREPVSWLPALGGWLVTPYELAVGVMRDDETFTVDDPRFSTSQVIGPSMLSLDGEAHALHRAPFAGAFRPGEVRRRFGALVEDEAHALIDGLPAGDGGGGGDRGAGRGCCRADLRRQFAGPLAAAVVGGALGLERDEVPALLGLYEAIVAAVTDITAGRAGVAPGRDAFAALSRRLKASIACGADDSLLAAVAGSREGAAPELPAGAPRKPDPRGLTAEQAISNAAVLLFGGIETTEGMITNALLHMLGRPAVLAGAVADPAVLAAAIEESLRLEPAAAAVDRYATRAVRLGGADVAAGDLVRVSLTAANRDPAAFDAPEEFRLARWGGGGGRTVPTRGHLAFAHGPHVCVGVHLARIEARVGITALLARLPGLRLDPERPCAVRGLIFRKPPALPVLWDHRAILDRT